MDDILDKVSKIFDEKVTTDTVLFSLPSWNSINFFALLTLLKEHYKKELPIMDVIECKTLGDILNLCK